MLVFFLSLSFSNLEAILMLGLVSAVPLGKLCLDVDILWVYLSPENGSDSDDRIWFSPASGICFSILFPHSLNQFWCWDCIFDTSWSNSDVGSIYFPHFYKQFCCWEWSAVTGPLGQFCWELIVICISFWVSQIQLWGDFFFLTSWSKSDVGTVLLHTSWSNSDVWSVTLFPWASFVVSVILLPLGQFCFVSISNYDVGGVHLCPWISCVQL